MLTVKQINSFGPSSKMYRKYDQNGLYLQVQPSGAKYWRMKYKINGKEKVYAIGVYHTKYDPNNKDRTKPKVIVSLKKAREIQNQIKVEIAQGIDPNAEKLATKNAKLGLDTFEVVARNWHSKLVDTWSKKHAKEVMSSLERDIFPYIGNMILDDIKPPQMIAIFERIEKRGAYVILRKVIQRCTQIFKHGINKGQGTGIPMAYSKSTFKSRKKVNHHFFKKDELLDYFLKLDKYKGEITTILGLKFTLLTFTRTSEVRFATWDEFDFENKIWTIPANRMKMGNIHIVPLSNQALDVIMNLKEINRAVPNC